MEWKRPGEAFTIECRHLEQGLNSLTVKRGIEKSEVLFMSLDKQLIKDGFKDRLQINGVFPSPDILIRNLTSNDTGPYWCFYEVNDRDDIKEEEGSGSVLLVVSSEALMTPGIYFSSLGYKRSSKVPVINN